MQRDTHKNIFNEVECALNNFARSHQVTSIHGCEDIEIRGVCHNFERIELDLMSAGCTCIRNRNFSLTRNNSHDFRTHNRRAHKQHKSQSQLQRL